MTEQEKCPYCGAEAWHYLADGTVGYRCWTSRLANGRIERSYTCRDNELATLRAENERLTANCNEILCAGCGQVIADRRDDEFVTTMCEHISQCEAHPSYKMAARLCELEAKNERLTAENAKLRAAVEKLPKTADGVPVVPGMELTSTECPMLRSTVVMHVWQKGCCGIDGPPAESWETYYTEDAPEAREAIAKAEAATERKEGE